MARAYRPTKRSVAHACQILRLGLILAAGLGVTAQLRIFEANICRIYYRGHDQSVIDAQDNITEALCKTAAVQQSVAQINGLLTGLSSFPALIAAVPYLALHRLMNRKKLLLLNVFGVLLMNLYYCMILYFYNVFDPRWLMLEGVFNFIGGGYAVLNSLLQAVVAENIPQDQLSSFQLYYTAGALLSKLAGTAVGLSLMKTSVWLAVTSSLVLHLLAVPIVYIFFQDTGVPSNTSRDGPHLLSDDDEAEEGEGSNRNSEFEFEDRPIPRSKWTLVWDSVKQFWVIILSCLLPIIVVTFYDTGDSFRFIMSYWMSRRYEWELREVGWVQLAETLWTSVVVALLPRLKTRFIHMPHTPLSRSTSVSTNDEQQEGKESSSVTDDHDMSEPSHSNAATSHTLESAYRDLTLTKLCILTAALGTFLFGFSWYRFSAIVSLTVLAGAHGFRDAYFSFLAFYVGKNRRKHSNNKERAEETEKSTSDLATVYMALSLVTMMAYSLGGWLVSQADAVGLGMSGDSKTSWATSTPVWFCTLASLGAWWIVRRHQKDVL